ncbi:hypothetical protein RMB03_19580 [Acinetobacter sp. V91_7]|uniref:hypothetical protein n=1 Tax=Acinetobacter TaxID=469 RepID=UPI002272C191|nr:MULTISPECIES: hypothetical protein [Acinetobacter]MDS7930094.1 hypothetical protein [Acinetobacter sp. V102_4]MDS7933544.1 hypothetical protein [Acinetobacter sp. V91_4B]MDS7965148.1 hypothetical protein [Acinetobacter sp. V91_7]MDS8027645.1 hypothetical protein [Acinetobacter sp. V91_13]GLG83625.1 hypothetical protein ACSO1_21470 [Acinetobacter calcoaceticus]
MDSENPELGQDQVEDIVEAVTQKIEEEPEKLTLGADEVKVGLAALDEDIVKEILTELGLALTAADDDEGSPEKVDGGYWALLAAAIPHQFLSIVWRLLWRFLQVEC